MSPAASRGRIAQFALAILGLIATSVGVAGPALPASSGRSPVHLVVALGQRGVQQSGPFRAAVERFGLRVDHRVFRTHPEWRIWDLSMAAGVSSADAVLALEAVPGVRWAEVDGTISLADPRAFPPTAAAGEVAPATTRVPVPAGTSRVARPPAGTGPALLSRSAATTFAPPPSTCTGTGGLAAGDPNDPLFCSEPGGPFYAEAWNLFCFNPASQARSVIAAAPAAPNASGICATGAWKLGATGRGTIVAILDSGVDYTHPDLRSQMVDETIDPLLVDPAFPGRAADGHVHGWNFYDDNAEPMDFYGHGTGRAGIVAAAADNGIGLAGVAPRARIMAVKVGDTYVVHNENLAEGAVYAADHGADVINTSLGITGNSHLLRQAVVYAYQKGVFWAEATANEYSTHHNVNANVDTVSGVGGLTADALLQTTSCSLDPATGRASGCQPATAQTTFVQKANFANYGGIQSLAAPIDVASTVAAAEHCGGDPLPGGRCYGKSGYSLHNGGTSTAAPHVAGAGSIVRSAGFLSGMCQGHMVIDAAFSSASCTSPSLDANEIRQLLVYTATRVHNSDLGTNNYPPSGGPTAAGGPYYPEQAGDPHTAWNIWSGFGRPDLYEATAYVLSGLVPPEAQLFGDDAPVTPSFAGLQGITPFGVYDPTKTPVVSIVGHVGAPHLPPGAAGITWKVQVAPCLEPVESDYTTIATGSGPRDGLLGRWTLPQQTTAQCAATGRDHPFNYPGTYSVRLLSTATDGSGSAIDYADPVAGVDPNDAPAPAPLVGQDRRVVFVRPHDSHDHAGSPYYLGQSGEGSPTLYDIEGRGELDVLVPTAQGTVMALRPDGSEVPGWPVSMDGLGASGVAHPASLDGVQPAGQIVGSVAVGDIDGDGQPEIVAASFKGGLYAWHRDGGRVPGFPVRIPPPPANADPPPGFTSSSTADAQYCSSAHPAAYAERFSDYGAIAAPVLADVEGRHDGTLDIVQAEGNGCVYAIRPDGSVAWSIYPETTGGQPAKIAATPAVGSLNGDGNLDIVVGTEEVTGSPPATTGRLYAFDGRTGRALPGWPVALPSLSASGVPTVASGVISSPALFPSTSGRGLQVADGVFLGGDPAHPVTTLNADGSAGITLNTAPAPGSNQTDGVFLYAVAQTAIGMVNGRLAQVSGGLTPALAADQTAAPGLKPTFQHVVGAWDVATGQPIPTFPRQIEDWQFLSGQVIADVKGDGADEIITGSGGGFVHAFDPSGTPGASPNLSTSLSAYVDYSEPAGFPVFAGTQYITSTPAAGQLSRGGPLSLVTMTRDGWLYITDTAGRPQANDQWWKFHHDERNTGQYGLDTRPPATVTDLTAGPGPGGSVVVGWTEVGDDWWVGKPAATDVRWSTSPITDANFTAASRIPTGAPGASGTRESVVAPGLPSGVPLYVAERSADSAGNLSLIAFAVLGISTGTAGGVPTPPTGSGLLPALVAVVLLGVGAQAVRRARRRRQR